MSDLTLQPVSRADAIERDRLDPLAFARDRFDLPADVIYLDGNSLGVLPRSTKARVVEAMTTEWGNSLIRGWNDHGWMTMAQTIGNSIARLIGAAPDTVICADNLSTNLFKLVTAALRLRPDRRVILTESHNFPSDLYVLEGIASVLGHEVRRVERCDIAASIDNDTALVVVTDVDYRSGERFDMRGVTDAAHSQGALVLWDLAHSAGAVEVDLNGLDVDFAAGCGYKYLNGGPGAPAFMYVARRLQPLVRPMLQGWLGHVDPFSLAESYVPAEGVGRLTIGTPPVLSMIALGEGVATYDGIEMAVVRAKSVELSDFFIRLVAERLIANGFNFILASPTDSAQRGSQVSYAHEHGYPIMQALIARGVIGDFRAPNLVRFGFTPLYLQFVDVNDAVQHLYEIMASNEWDQPKFHQRNAVT